MPRRAFLLGAAGFGAAALGAGEVLAAPRRMAAPALNRDPSRFPRETMRYADFVQRRTGERFRGVYFEHGRYLPDALREVDWVLRDDHVDVAVLMDPRLIDLMSDIRRDLEHHQMMVTSAYRTPETNERLCRTSGAAKRSLHLKGMAVDFFSPQLSVSRIARIAAAKQAGGVGRYDRRGFVHVDVGEIRYWRG